MTDWLNKPFPLIETMKQKLIISFLFASFIYVFLFVFQPFGLFKHEENLEIYLLGFFFITLFVMLFSFFIFPLVFKKIFDPEKWNVKKEIYFSLQIITVIGFFNWLYNSITGMDMINQYNLLSFLLITIAVGIFPTVFLIIYFEKYFYDKHAIIADKLTDIVHTAITKNNKQILKILSDNAKDEIIIELEHFLCIRSEGNYIHVFFIENNQINKKLIRNSLTKVSQELLIFESIKRCHRSFLVNLQKIETVTGNARNYNFHIENLGFEIPVSRNFPKSIIENIKK